MKLTTSLLDDLSSRAKASPRLRMNLDLRNSAEDGSQRMLNALEPGTILPIHRHTRSTETVVLIRGSVRQNYYNPDGSLAQSFIAAAGTSPNASAADCMGFSVPAGQWHNTECLDPEPYSSNARTAPTPLSGRRISWSDPSIFLSTLA